MSAEEIILKPCPFCGGKASLKEHLWQPTNFIVYCSNVGCFLGPCTIFDSKAGACEKWNKRVGDYIPPNHRMIT
jgi:hypothetical protein